MKEESKLWQKVKKNTPGIRWTRVESWASFGFPDLVGYTEKQGFFTVELKVTKSNKVALSPHQIGFHLTHPNNSFIMLKTLGPLAIKLFEGRFIEDLIKGKADPCATGMESSLKFLQNV